MELIKPQKGTNYNIENDIQNLTNIEQEFEQIDNKITNDISSSINELKDKVDNDITTAITELDNKVDTEIVTAIDNLETKVNTEISESITALDNKVTTSLQEQAESLKKEISDQIAKVVANSPEDFDTLKEISDWISGHSSDAAAMNSTISGNTSAINQEILDRQAADAALQTNINKKANTSSVFIKTILIPTYGTSPYIYYKFKDTSYPILAMNDSSPNTIGFLTPDSPYFICLYNKYNENSSWTLTGIYWKDGYYYLRLSGYQALLLLSSTSIFYESSKETDFLKTDLGDSVNYQVPQLMTKILSDKLFDSKANKTDLNSYIKKLAVSGKTITYTKGDNSTGTITTQDTTYSAATQSAQGLMSAADKKKLDGIIVDSSLSSTSTNPVQNKVVYSNLMEKASVTALNNVVNALNSKVDEVSGKGLSTNDYTTTEKNKLAGIAEGANKTVVDSSLSSTSTNPVQNKAIYSALSSKANSSDLNNKANSDHTHTSLKRTQIASGTDLNNLTTPGEYYAIDNTTYTNAPCQNFTMQVIKLMSGYVFQVLYAYSSSRIYTRSTMYNGGNVVWTSWIQSASTTDYLKIRTSAPTKPQAGDIWIG